MAATTTPTATSSSSSASPSLPLGIVQIINKMADDQQPPWWQHVHITESNSYSFEPTPTKSIGHEPFTSSVLTSLNATSTSTSTQTPTLQTYTPPPFTGPWYEAGWVGPATWLLIIYCIASAICFAVLWLSGILDFHLNLHLVRRHPEGVFAWYGNRIPTPPPTNNNNIRMRQMSNAARRQAGRYRDSVETELGDPEEDRTIEDIRRQWADRGIHFTGEQLRAQQQAYEQSAARTAARNAERVRSDALVLRNLQRYVF